MVADHAVTALGSESLGQVGNFAVIFFFVLSGLVLTRQWDGHFGRFLLGRFLRLWPVFALCLACGYALAGTRPEYAEFFWIPWPRYDANHICPPLWSLFIEAWSALLMPAIVWSARGGVVRSLACIAALVSLTIVYYPPTAFLRAFESYLVFFVVGAALSRTALRSPMLESRLPQFLGRISYSLYLVHWLAIEAGRRWFGPAGVYAAVPLAFLAAWGVWWAVERPSISLARRVRYRRSARLAGDGAGPQGAE